jgi:hypothetical protein
MATINIYHIIEQASQCGQQTVEVWSNSLQWAIEQLYIPHSTNEQCCAVIHEDNMTTYIFPEEKLEIIHETEYRVFAKWTHFRGLY